MREEGIEAAREAVAPQAFAFDGWSMVPLDAPRNVPPTADTPVEVPASIPA